MSTQAGVATTVHEEPRITRVRHELKRRALTVARVERVPLNMVRVVLNGEELEGFISLGFDDHIKVFFPTAMRDFTPRRLDADAGELWIDIFLHDGGPAASWAAQARAGQRLEIGGPKGSSVIDPDGIDGYVLIGDETALPAICRKLEELSSNSRVLVVLETDEQYHRPVMVSRAALDVLWVFRNGRDAEPGRQLIDVLRGADLPPGRCFFWVASETRAARAIRRHLRQERGIAKQWIKAAGYWQPGIDGTSERISNEE